MAVYVPSYFDPNNRAAVVRLMHDYPFATLISPGVFAPESSPALDPLLTHLPLLYVADCEPYGSLLGHFARANPHAQAAGGPSIAVFHGPHAYVSPAWYGEPESAVPTWNYAVVHVHGSIQLVANPAETRAILDALITRFESMRPAPWQLMLDPIRLDAMVGAIIGFRLRIKRLEPKFKLSQNRDPRDRRGVAAGLVETGHAEAIATAEWMRTYAGAEDGKE